MTPAAMPLLAALHELNFEPAVSLQSVVLIGGKGTRLSPARKVLRREDYPALDERYFGTIGPKGLARMTCSIGGKSVSKAMTDWHLDIHAATPEVTGITLALGTGADVVRRHYDRTHDSTYRGIPLRYVTEEHPAGTLAGLIKAREQGFLADHPVVYANGDNLIDQNLYLCYLRGCLAALRNGLQPRDVVIDVASLVGWEESSRYGALDMDLETGVVRGFAEKRDASRNARVCIHGIEYTPINSGFSIIPDAQAILDQYLTPAVVETIARLERGEAEYASHEAAVRYETMYARIAAEGRLVAVYEPCFWMDLGTEEKIAAAEHAMPATDVFGE